MRQRLEGKVLRKRKQPALQLSLSLKSKFTPTSWKSGQSSTSPHQAKKHWSLLEADKRSMPSRTKSCTTTANSIWMVCKRTAHNQCSMPELCGHQKFKQSYALFKRPSLSDFPCCQLIAVRSRVSSSNAA